MQRTLAATALASALCAGQAAFAAVYSEPPDAGEGFGAARYLGALSAGTHTISGSVACTTESVDDFFHCGSDEDFRDLFRYDIEPGSVLTGFEIDISNFVSSNPLNIVQYQLLKGGEFTSNRIFVDSASQDEQTGNLLSTEQGADFYFFAVQVGNSPFETNSISLDYTAAVTVDGPTPPAIPLPASALLLAAALGGLGVLRRRG